MTWSSGPCTDPVEAERIGWPARIRTAADAVPPEYRDAARDLADEMDSWPTHMAAAFGRALLGEDA